MKGLLLVALLGLSSLVRSAEVEPGVWTKDFPKALALARAEAKPLVMITHSSKCHYCRLLRGAMSNLAFENWLKASGAYIVNVQQDDKVRSSVVTNAQAFSRMLAPQRKAHGYPELTVYWADGTNVLSSAVLTARRGRLDQVNKHKSLLDEFTSVIAAQFDGYYVRKGIAKPVLDQSLRTKAASSAYTWSRTGGPDSLPIPAGTELKTPVKAETPKTAEEDE